MQTGLQEKIAYGERLFSSGQAEKARIYFEGLLEQNPASSPILNNLGVICFDANELDRSYLFFKTALETDPYYHYSITNLLRLFKKDPLRFQEGIDLLLPCLKKDLLPPEALHDVTSVWNWTEALSTALIKDGYWNISLRLLLEYRKKKQDKASKEYLLREFRHRPIKICLVMDQGIGNMVMATPALRALKKIFPHSLLEVVGRKASLEVIKGWRLVNRHSDYQNLDFSLSRDVILLSIWSNDFITTHRDILGSIKSVIVKSNFTDPGRHEAEYHLDLARFMGYEGDIPLPYCRRKKVALPFSRHRPVALLSDTTFNSPEWQRKRWPYYPELAKKLVDMGYQVGLIGGNDEAKIFDEKIWPPGIFNLMGKYSIPQTAYIISKADIFIGNDSGPAHISGALGKAAFIIFGATRESKNRPLGKNVQVVSCSIACRPCQYTEKWTACTKWYCMSKLSVNHVFAAIKQYHSIKKIKALEKITHRYSIRQLSIVIPTYNRSRLLSYNIRKGLVLGQTAKIIVDDNSGAPHEQILKRLEDSNVRVIFSSRNEGVAKALTKGTYQVDTMYTTFGGDDDQYYVLDQEGLYKEMHLLEDDYVVISSRYVISSYPRKKTYKIGYNKEAFQDNKAAEILKFMFSTGEMGGILIGNIYRTEDIRRSLPDSIFRVSEDKVFMSRLLGNNLTKKVHISDNIVYVRRFDEDNLSKNYDHNKIFLHFLSLLVCGYYCLNNGLIQPQEILFCLTKRAVLLDNVYGFGLSICDNILKYLYNEITFEDLIRSLKVSYFSSKLLPPEIDKLKHLLLDHYNQNTYTVQEMK